MKELLKDLKINLIALLNVIAFAALYEAHLWLFRALAAITALMNQGWHEWVVITIAAAISATSMIFWTWFLLIRRRR